mmetsp:Transcript_27018/g.57888  ORF Transcript_27018/g.57888 Transcript_27018/m.57888 type:complete len:700 (-) Transcript_27018:713-2812(-)|eukprot:CAMPEP_0172301372 /NCGR_PEP_ID=MMETSP1058-20130122/3282_1 /TAXON_ID=83371 /ORGANISM="Detonula confervacea, Strain CCMP 353" /LENGTH=699 /DNA_ID=CAMNT_0013011461 /DNA_START=160 /DNA_END=2259 /DNA_ORIENTATION=-
MVLQEESQTSQQQQQVHRRSLPSHLLWRSVLGAPAAWSGSSSRGVYLLDSTENRNGRNGGNGMLLLQKLPTDRRMFHLPVSLRDVIVDNIILSPAHTMDTNDNNAQSNNPPNYHSKIQLLSHPRIVGAAPPRSSTFHSAGRAFSGTSSTSNGISCMDLDRGNTLTGSPPRYLLVGSGGGDCSIALYDLSYFGSDHHLYQQSPSSNKSSHSMNSQSLHHQSNNQSSVTHRPIARSLRQQNNSASGEENASGVPSGHRQPLLGVHWYPGDPGAFLSASISGEILVWDAQHFVPVFATYTHIYAGAPGMSAGGMARADLHEEGKSVAPLQCMDLPKTPEGCPHGNALLALGLGADGRGVIQLCDAFRGGSATHELIGHGTGGGGVNAVAWDPHHPFRLASGGDDCTVRLWDIRKAGAAACLGVLNRENEMDSGGDTNDDWTLSPRKRQRTEVSMPPMRGVESHGGPVTALTFAPGGDDLVSTGLDGRLYHWDLRPDACFVSSVAAIRSMERGGGGMDPSVATGGRLVPTCFSGVTSKSPSQRPQSRRIKASLAIIQPGSRSTTTLLSTTDNSKPKGQITGYSLFGRRGKEPGGCPDFILNGHLADVTCLVPIVEMWDNMKVGRCDDTINNLNLLTGGKDGMVLSWGSSRRRSNVSENGIDGHDNHPGKSYESRGRFRGGNVGICNHPPSFLEEESIEDKDNW